MLYYDLRFFLFAKKDNNSSTGKSGRRGASSTGKSGRSGPPAPARAAGAGAAIERRGNVNVKRTPDFFSDAKRVSVTKTLSRIGRMFSGVANQRNSLMILPQVHLRKPCYDFYFL